MYFRWILQNLPHEAIQNLTIQVVEYLRTFSVNDFKYYFGLDAITVCRHPSGCLFFTSRIKECGIVNCDKVPDVPFISIAKDSMGHLLFILHEKGNLSKSIKPYHVAKDEKPRYTPSREYYSPTYEEYESYVEDSYLDAFEGDPDAMWNID